MSVEQIHDPEPEEGADPIIRVVLDQRQITEIQLAQYYSEKANHGTDGHHRLNLIAILSRALGFRLGPNSQTLLFLPSTVQPTMIVPPGAVAELSPEDARLWLSVESQT